jgi:GH15 family glucan-1,4-alpha-glucosidase
VSDPTDERRAAPAESADGDPYVPLERYAMIGDAGTAALVSDTGSIDWLCLPRFDSDPVFGRLLDPDAGYFSVAPSVPFSARRAYVPATAVLATTFSTSSGRATTFDFFDARDVRTKRRGLVPFRPLIRRVRGEVGSVPFVADVAPRDSFGTATFRLRADGRRLVADLRGRSLLVHAPTPWSPVRGASAACRFDVRAGETSVVSMAYAGRDVGVLPYGDTLSEAAFDETVAFWKGWSRRAASFGSDAVTTSAVVLKLLTFAPSGGIVAAPTTSLPESPGGSRNWDYRFVWVRDASWTVDALSGLGYEDEAGAYLGWAMNTMLTSRPRIHSLYTVYGSPRVSERDVPGLRGYRRARPVRIGNAAVEQRQLDNWGHLVDIAYKVARGQGGLGRDMRDGIASLVRFVAEHWREPDHGMWEVRSEPDQFVHSKVMAWVALDRGVRLARDFGMKGPAEAWERERDRVKQAVLNVGVHPEAGCLTRAFGSNDLDASLLLILTTGFLPPSDPRMSRTIDAVRDRLGRDELVDRYRGVDGLNGDEGAFLACSFWLAHALALDGRVADAEKVFDAASAHSNDVGLLPEEIDRASGEFLGNFPQALSHIALINAARAIADPRSV